MTRLPAGWSNVALNEVADVVMGQSPPGSSYNKDGEGLPSFQGKADFTRDIAKVRIYTTAGTKFASAGDVLMSVRAPVGPTNLCPSTAVIGRGLAGIRAKGGLTRIICTGLSAPRFGSSKSLALARHLPRLRAVNCGRTRLVSPHL